MSGFVGHAGDCDADEARDVIVCADQIAGLEGVHVVAEENSGVVGEFGMGFGIVGYEIAFFAAGSTGFGRGVDNRFICPRALRVAGVIGGDLVPVRIGGLDGIHSGHQIERAGGRRHLVHGVFGSDSGDSA